VELQAGEGQWQDSGRLEEQEETGLIRDEGTVRRDINRGKW
jgi:hypothetical protein